jgi:hypothetical protein
MIYKYLHRNTNHRNYMATLHQLINQCTMKQFKKFQEKYYNNILKINKVIFSRYELVYYFLQHL